MLTMGRSAPSMTPCCAAGMTSPHAIGTAMPPSPLIVSANTLACCTRILRPRRSFGSAIGRLLFQKWRKPIIVEEQDLELVLVLELLIEPVADRAVEHLIGLVVAGDQ